MSAPCYTGMGEGCPMKPYESMAAAIAHAAPEADVAAIMRIVGGHLNRLGDTRILSRTLVTVGGNIHSIGTLMDGDPRGVHP